MTLRSQLRRDFLSPKFPRALVAGWILATIVVLYCFAVSAIIFRGPLLPFAAEGAGMLLFGAAVLCLLVGLSSGYRGALAVPQDTSAAVLGTMATTVAAGTAYAPAQTTFMTMTALLIISSLITGLALAAIGHFRLSNLFRFIPYPVTGGFFAGTGWTVSVAALALMSGVPLDWETLPLFLDSGNLWKWAPGAVYGLILALVMKRRNSIAILFASLVAVTAAFHLILFLLDLSVEDAEAAGLVLSGIPEGGLWPVFGLSDFAHVDWGVVAGQFPGVVAVATITLLCRLVYVNGLEVATGAKLDVDREFRAAGFAGIVADAGGSAPGAHSIVLCLASRMMGADTPWTGIVTSLASEFTARQRRSTMYRSVPDRAILYNRGALLRGYRLRGYIFFGSAHPLIEELKRPLGESPSPSCILLDFSAVSGCDLSAANVLCQFVRLAHRAGVRTVFSKVSRQLEGSLRKNLPVESWEQIWFEPDFESGLERCEGLLERLDPWLEPREYAEGETLSLQGEVRDGVQLLVSGLVSVHDAEGTRLHHCGPGDVLDPWSAFEDKNVASTTAIARTPCRTMMLTPVARERLESDDNELTLRFFAYIIRRQPPSGLVLDGD